MRTDRAIQQTLIGFLFLLLAGACASRKDVLAAKDQGTSQVYDVGPDKAWEIAKTVFHWERTGPIEEHRSEGYMETSSGSNMMSYGTLMAAWVEAAGNGQSKVTVVTKRRHSMTAVTNLTETTFHKRFAQAVDLVKDGKPLPEKRPKD